MEENKPLRCFGCSRLSMKDYGWSDWTVEGTQLQCQANQFEDVEDKEENKIFEVAEKCQCFNAGNPLRISVDGEIN